MHLYINLYICRVIYISTYLCDHILIGEQVRWVIFPGSNPSCTLVRVQ